MEHCIISMPAQVIPPLYMSTTNRYMCQRERAKQHWLSETLRDRRTQKTGTFHGNWGSHCSEYEDGCLLGSYITRV